MKNFIIVIIASIIVILPNKARAEEPNWDKIVPIIIQLESGGNPHAVSKKGRIGLMQISPVVFNEFKEMLNFASLHVHYGWIKCEENKYDMSSSYHNRDYMFFKDYKEFKNKRIDLYNPKINKFIGTWYLKRIWYHYLPYYRLEEIKEKPLLLLVACYNGGIGNVVKWYKKGAKYDQLPQETKRYYEKFYKMYRMQK